MSVPWENESAARLCRRRANSRCVDEGMPDYILMLARLVGPDRISAFQLRERPETNRAPVAGPIKTFVPSLEYSRSVRNGTDSVSSQGSYLSIICWP